jgi:hypothetical protein
MNTRLLICGLVILLVANILMLFVTPSQLSPSREGFANYYLQNGAGAASTGRDTYQPIGAFDNVRLETGNNVSQWKYNTPNEPLMGPEFEPGPDSLFLFKNNQCKPECCGGSFSCDGGCVCTSPKQRALIAGRGGNRTSPAGDI